MNLITITNNHNPPTYLDYGKLIHQLGEWGGLGDLLEVNRVGGGVPVTVVDDDDDDDVMLCWRWRWCWCSYVSSDGVVSDQSHLFPLGLGHMDIVDGDCGESNWSRGLGKE